MIGGGDLVLGVDGGGTNVRILVANTTGAEVARATGGGVNPVSHGRLEARRRLALALRSAIAGVNPSRIVAAGVGIAGVLGGADLDLAGIWSEVGLTCRATILSDTEVAFAAGSASVEGLVVLAGTGAVIGEIRGGRLARHLDGYGYLLGDEGSGYWLGHQAVRAVLLDLDGRGAATALTPAICARYGVAASVERGPAGTSPRTLGVVRAVYADPPVALARLAPVVCEAAASGDQVAAALIEAGADRLLGALDALRHDAPDLTVVVLAGGLLLEAGPMRDRMALGLRGRGLEFGEATDGAAGAAWCVLRDRPDVLVEVHARLTGR